MNGKYGVGSEILIKAKIVEAQTKLDSGDMANTIYVLEVPIPDDEHRFKVLEEDKRVIKFVPHGQKYEDICEDAL